MRGLGSASLARGFHIDFAMDCLRDQRPVLAQVDQSGSVVVLGALQTRRQPEHDGNGMVHLIAKRIKLQATEEAEMHIGKSSLRLDQTGVVHLTGRKLTVDMTAVVRVLSALVDLP